MNRRTTHISIRKAPAKTISFSAEMNARFCYILAAVIMCLAAYYGISMYKIISNTVAVKNIEKKTADMQSSVQELDAKYISLSNKITPQMAAEYGLNQVKVSAYIERTKTIGSAKITERGM